MNKQFGKFILLITVLSIGGLQAYAQLPDGQELLKAAINYTKMVPFKGERSKSQSGKPEFIIYSDSGKVRTESFGYIGGIGYAWKVYLYNPELTCREYYWYADSDDKCMGDNVVGCTFLTQWTLMELLEQLEGVGDLKGVLFSVGDGEYNGVGCYKLTIRFASDSKTIGNALSWRFSPRLSFDIANDHQDSTIFQRALSEEEAKAYSGSDNYVAVIELRIDKHPTKPFVYSLTEFNTQGKEIHSTNFGNVTFPPSLDADVFQLPPDTTVQTANNMQEEINIYFKSKQIVRNELAAHSGTSFAHGWMAVIKDNITLILFCCFALLVAVGVVGWVKRKHN